MRRQLKLSIACAAAWLVVLLGLPLANYFAPELMATRASGLIGNGLYGVDLKQVGDRVLVIEVNDNPSIDHGYEDAALGKELYRVIMAEFMRRLEQRVQGAPPVSPRNGDSN